MSVILKRSQRDFNVPKECKYGCCTVVYGDRRVIRSFRRQTKRLGERLWRTEWRKEMTG